MRTFALIFVLLSALLAFNSQAQSTDNTAQDNLASIAGYTANMQHQEGFFDFYHDQAAGKIYLKVPRSAEQFIFQTSLPWGLGSNDIGLDRGQLGATRLASFYNEGDKVLLVHHNTEFRAYSDNQAERDSIDEAFADSVLAGFQVVVADADALLIDYTPFLLSDTHGVTERLAQTQQGQYKVATERSVIYPKRSKAFVDNTELEAKITFTGQAKGAYVRSVAADANHLTLHLHHSFIRLPDDQYQPRTFHPQSGFWSHSFQNYAAGLGEDLTVQYIPRHRFSEDQPIIYYLDPGVPEPVRTALLEGGRWWNQAFTELGYENGFQLKQLPADADPMDVRYNVIQWVHRSTRGWSYGASVTDPRTGEIIKGHVTLGSLRVRQDMLIAQGLLAPYQTNLSAEQRQQQLQAIEDMALARIRQLSAHEIGHTLGIAHNFAASADDRASVMDYPHPLVSIDTDSGQLTLAQAYKEGLGLWDKRVVAYGYGQQDLAEVLQQNRNLGLSFISDRDARAAGGAHPDAHLWDNGSDAVTELERVLAVRQTAMQQFGLANLAPQQPLSRLRSLWVPIYLLHRYQTEAAVKMLAGVHYDYAVNDGREIDYRPVNAAQQQRALRILLATASAEQLQAPVSATQRLLPLAYGEPNSREHFTGHTGLIADPIAMASSAARFSLDLILHPQRLERLQQQHDQDQQIPAVAEVLAGLNQKLLEPAQAVSATVLQQQLALEALTAVVHAYQQAAQQHALQAQLLQFMQQQQQQWQEAPNSAQKQLVLHSLTRWFAGEAWPLQSAAALPPGSPI